MDGPLFHHKFVTTFNKAQSNKVFNFEKTRSQQQIKHKENFSSSEMIL